MRIRALSLLLGIFAALSVLGCPAKSNAAPPPEAQTKTIEVSYADLQKQKFITRSIALAVGDTLTLILASNGSTGFAWTAEAQISDPTVVQQTGHETVESTTTMPGAWGTEVWTFTAIKAGATAISTDYSQPWEGGSKKVWTFTAQVTVQ